MGWNRALQKNNFSGSKKIVFFAHAWTASNPRKINMWVDLGTWNIVIPNDLEKTEALQKINLRTWKHDVKYCSFSYVTWNILITMGWRPGWSPACNNSDTLRAQTTGNQENDILTDPVRCLNNPPARLEPLTFKIEVRHATITLQESYFQLILPLNLSLWFGCKWLGLAWFTEKKGCAKKQLFSCFLHANLMKLRQARLCKKTTFQALKNHFFACLLSNACNTKLLRMP